VGENAEKKIDKGFTRETSEYGIETRSINLDRTLVRSTPPRSTPDCSPMHSSIRGMAPQCFQCTHLSGEPLHSNVCMARSNGSSFLFNLVPITQTGYKARPCARRSSYHSHSSPISSSTDRRPSSRLVRAILSILILILGKFARVRRDTLDVLSIINMTSKSIDLAGFKDGFPRDTRSRQCHC